MEGERWPINRTEQEYQLTFYFVKAGVPRVKGEITLRTTDITGKKKEGVVAPTGFEPVSEP
jgi:hypothetical protein